MEALDSCRQDITMLWLFKASNEWLQKCKLGRELTDWLENKVKVSEGVARSAEFQREVTREFKQRGVRPVAPERVVDSWNKQETKDLCMSAGWPKPFSPVMLQTRPGPMQKGAGAFIVFSSWQDAVFALIEMSRTKLYRGRSKDYPAEMVFENQLVDMDGYDIPCRVILDCDAKLSEFNDEYSVEELLRVIDEVPAWFCQRLVEIGAIGKTDRVIVVEKEKSRKDKASRHYVFSIMAFSTWDTQNVLARIFLPEDAEAKKESKKLACCKLVDRVPHHGRGQYSVLGFFDRNKKETEYPCLTRRMEIVNGQVVSRRSCKVMDRSVSGLQTPDDPHARQLLQEACYSFLTPDFITMHPKFMTKRDTVSPCFHACHESRTHGREAIVLTGKKSSGVGPAKLHNQKREHPPQEGRR